MNNLQNILKQKQPFKNPRAQAEVGFMYISYMLNSSQQEFFKPYKITLQQYNVLRILRGQFPNSCNINEIKERMLDKMSDASRIVERLIKLDLVVKETSIADKRNKEVLITEKALALLADIDTKFYNKSSLLDNLTEEEISKINELFDKVLKSD